MAEENSELVIVADRIYITPFEPPVEALLVRGGRVAAAGTVREIRAIARADSQVREYPGATATAGFTDSHVHLSTWALARRNVDLGGALTIAEAAARVEERARVAAGWIVGHGWSRHSWSRLPTRADLDAVVPSQPVLLDSQDIHAAWLNSEALRLCGITRDTPDPEGGRIVRDERGEPTGVLLEEARAFARRSIPATPEPELLQALDEAQAAALSLGITGIHSVEAEGLRDFTALEQTGRLKLRVLQHIQLAQLDAAIAVGLRSGFGGDRLSIGGVKMFLDGSLGSRTAWMRQSYEGGGDDDRGIQTLSASDFRTAVKRAAENGLASTIHAIGDAAVELALDTLESIAPPAALPHRIEHLQLCPPDLWERAAASGIIASVQSVHILTDISPAEQNWGEARSRGAYPFAALLRRGMTLALGSDVPVETLDPRPGLYGATRRGSWADYTAGELSAGWFPEHALTGAEAVAGYTIGPAEAANQQLHRGSLRPGFDADLVIWSRDPVSASPEDYAGLECLMTMIGGEMVFQRGVLMIEAIERAAELLTKSPSTVISTGAGMSRESGIPTFRDAMDGLWAHFDPQELATAAAFRANPARVWSWYEHRRRTILACQPHAGHFSVAELCRLLPGVTLCTQNVDGLHAAAGSEEVLELHGNIMRSRCIDCAQPAPTPDPGPNDVVREPPVCGLCGSLVRPDVVWFGEMLPLQTLEAAWERASSAEVMLVIGTSGVVWPAAELPRLTSRAGGVVIEVNPVRSELTEIADLFVQGPAGAVLPQIVASIRSRLNNG